MSSPSWNLDKIQIARGCRKWGEWLILPQCALASQLTAREQAKGAAKAPTPLETSRSLESDYDRSLAWVAVWTPSIANMLETFVTTTMTRQYFVEDIDRYMCSIRVNLPDMRAFLSERLRSYPMYVAEMVKLLTTLYARDEISRGVDPDLAKFILQRVTSCKRSLIKDKQLGTFLRDRFEGKAKIEALLRYSETSQDELTRILQSMERNIGDSPTTAALLSAFLESHLAARDPTLRLPTAPAAHASPKHSIDAESVHAMHNNRRLLVAKRDYVHGTMRVDSSGEVCTDPRNKAFGFSRGDLLVNITEERLVERYRPKSIVLQNQRKEIGEINYDPGVLVELHHLVSEKDDDRAEPTSPASIGSYETSNKRQRVSDCHRPSV